jgi:hypothetical protein
VVGHPRHADRVEEEQVTEHHHVARPDVDLNIEEVRDRQDRRVTTEYAERAADEAMGSQDRVGRLSVRLYSIRSQGPGTIQFQLVKSSVSTGIVARS